MTENERYRLPIDPDQALVALRPAFMELGIRDVTAFRDALLFKIGVGSSTAWVDLSLNEWDLYDVEIFKCRSGKHRTLSVLESIYWDDLAERIVAEWCDYCTG